MTRCVITDHQAPVSGLAFHSYNHIMSNNDKITMGDGPDIGIDLDQADISDMTIDGDNNATTDPQGDLPDLGELSISEQPTPIGSGTPAADPAPEPTLTNEELERFRRDWERDLKSKKKKEEAPVGKGKGTQGDVREQNIPRESGSVRSPRGPESGSGGGLALRAMPEDLDDDDEIKGEDEAGIAASSSRPLASTTSPKLGGIKLGTSSTSKDIPAPRVDRKDQAISLYSRAVESEQTGKLNEALIMYRKAFKLDGECHVSPLGKRK